MSETDVAPLTTTIKLPGASAPWIVVRSSNSAQLDAQLNELMQNGVGATIGRAQEMIEAQYNMGKGLEARSMTVPADTGAFQQPFQQPPVDPSRQQQLAPQAYAPPQPQYTQPPQQYQPEAQGAAPGAPMVAGMPAKLISGQKNGRQWQAWADPRPKEVTEHMQRTDDPNDPGLANGTKSLWRFIK